jgi:hypothetical protein
MEMESCNFTVERLAGTALTKWSWGAVPVVSHGDVMQSLTWHDDKSFTFVVLFPKPTTPLKSWGKHQTLKLRMTFETTSTLKNAKVLKSKERSKTARKDQWGLHV